MATTVADNPFDAQPASPSTATTTASAPAPTPAPASGLIGQAAQYTPVTPTVDKATETSAGQLDTLLSGDSPLMQRARTLAQQQMAGRGLVNSSMAIESGTAAMIDKATPIALQDASIYAGRAQFNAAAQNEATQFNTGETNKFSLQDVQNRFTSAQNDLNRAHEVAMQDKSIQAQINLQQAQQAFQAAQSDLDRAQQRDLASQQLSWQSQENSLARQQQTYIAQLEQQGMDSRQAQALSQQWAVAQLEQAGITNRFDQQLAMQSAQFNATQVNEQQRMIQQQQFTLDQMGYQATLNRQTVPTQYAANVASNMQASINQILADGNLDSTSKSGAINNVVNAANAQLDWAESFYGTQIPNLAAPASAVAAPAPTAVPSYTAPAPSPVAAQSAGGQDAWGRVAGDPNYGVNPIMLVG